MTAQLIQEYVLQKHALRDMNAELTFVALLLVLALSAKMT